MLSMTKVDLDLISEDDTYLFFERGMRGNASYNSKRDSKANNKHLTYSKANNKHLTSYDPEKPTKYITYLDEKNLYGYAMSKFLSTGGFKWLYPTKFNLHK